MAEVKAPAANKNSGAFRNYEEWFTQSPDPWAEITALEVGGDRTFASTVQRIVANAEPGQRVVIETRLLAALARPKITDAGRMFVCRMLAWVGSDTSIPALAALLGDARFADAARYALEAMPGEAVDRALLSALDKLTGPPKAGLIGTIALREILAGVPLLARIATNSLETPEVRAAAARGLTRIQAKSCSS